MPRLIVLIALVFGLNHASAQDVFTVAEVPVAAEAETAAQAQAMAREQGRKAALDLLLRRLVAEEDWDYLPNLSAGEPAPAAPTELDAYQAETPQDDRYDRYDRYGQTSDPFAENRDPRRALTLTEEQVRAFELETNVFNEKSSGTTYRAQITYRFKPESIRNTLRAARIPYSEEQAREVLILPVLITPNDTYLWEAKNPWARAWLERPLGNELTPMALPVGDVLDIQALTADEARELNAAALRAFLERYDNSTLYLAIGRLTEENGEFRLYVELVNATPPSLDGTGRSTSAIGTEVLSVFFRGSDDDFPALARRAVQATVQRHAAAWKRRTRVDYGLQRTLELTAWFREQREFSHIQEAVGGSALVIDWDPGVFNSENALMTLTVVGEEDQFRLAMRERDLDVWQDRDGRWHIAELDLAEELKARSEPLRPDLIDEQNERRRGLGRFFGRGNRDDNRFSEPQPETETEDESDDIPELPDDLFGDDDGR